MHKNVAIPPVYLLFGFMGKGGLSKTFPDTGKITRFPESQRVCSGPDGNIDWGGTRCAHAQPSCCGVQTTLQAPENHGQTQVRTLFFYVRAYVCYVYVFYF